LISTDWPVRLVTDRLDDKHSRELDGAEFDDSAGSLDGRSQLPGPSLEASGQTIRAKTVLARQVSEQPGPAVELTGLTSTPTREDVLDDTGTAPGRRVRLLEEDPDLAQGLPEPVRSALTEQLWVHVLDVRSGLWRPPALDPGTNFGLLILDGLIGRRIQIQRAVAVELVGIGDVIRPWASSERWDTVPSALQWQVFAPARLAVLDERVMAVTARRPELMVAFTDRLLRRLRAMSSLMAISHMTRVEDRLLGTLWQIADGCGRVTSDGVRIPIRLTHRTLADLVGAKRPSVTVALQQLRERGEVTRGDSGDYILAGRPPIGG